MYFVSEKFSVGDIVIANEKANVYRTTKEGWVGVVIDNCPGKHFMDVRDVNDKTFTWHLCKDFFDKLERSK